MKKKYRNFDDEFRREVISRIDNGEISKSQAAREYAISPSLIDRWRKQIHDGTMRSRVSRREKQLERELEMYKKKVGEQSILIDLLKKINYTSACMRKSSGYVVTGKPVAPKEKGAK